MKADCSLKGMAMKYLTLRLIAYAALMAPSVAVIAQEVEERVTGHELCLRWAEQARGMFPVVCADNMAQHVVWRGASDISDNQLVMLIKGGSDEDRLVALQIVHQMSREGKAVAIAFGPNPLSDTPFFMVDFLAHGERTVTAPITDSILVSTGDMEERRRQMTQLAHESYEANFPR